jgi:uncharacterized membrane protein
MKVKDTKIGKWLKDKAPQIAEVVGDVLPNEGVLGIIKNLIQKEKMSAEELKEFQRLTNEIYLETARLEQKDKESARIREVEYIKQTGHADWMMIFVGLTIMITFLGLMILIVFKPIPTDNEHIVVNAIGILEGLVLSVAGYYYGSSLGSRIKDMRK